MFRRADVQRDTPHVALVNGTYHLGYDGIAHAVGKGCEILFRGAYHFGHQRDAGTVQNVAYGLG